MNRALHQRRSAMDRGSPAPTGKHRRRKRQMFLLVAFSLLAGCGDDIVTSEAPKPLENPSVFQNQSSPFRSEVVEVVLAPGVGTEVQSVLAKDQVILYQWNTDGALVYSDFHGHDPADDSFWVQYREDQEGLEDYGSLVAPFAGQHGWYFRNDGDAEIVIRLRVSGYFTDIVNHGML